ncbi:hypothetical protein [Geodermatophilus marinus]|uniref:hypothetical protein n=1 Tax=Geodermatophilus sp. LHW52908 TaxID=2303986 RepID=UPI000E3CA9F1|nr:hypothetical protein [Geodermatophilus sp. LHW52908]RFU21656.1 hypothetical protein D0Z06_10710 [Geodermatophilus sp. LHW52908]
MTDDRSSAILIRVWFEGEGAFRARLTAVGDASAGAPDGTPGQATVAVVASPGAVVAAVEEWLAGLLHPDPGSPGS